MKKMAYKRTAKNTRPPAIVRIQEEVFTLEQTSHAI